LIVYQIKDYAHVGVVLNTGNMSVDSCILVKNWPKKC